MSMTLGMSSTTLHMLYNIGALESKRDATMTRLSTGNRINQAKDDPSGIVALSAMNGDMARINTAINNNERSLAVLDTADATLMAVNDLIKEIESAAINATDPNATSAETAAYQSTVDQSLDAIDSLMATAAFNSTKLFDGSAAEIAPTVTDANDIISDEHVYTRDGNASADVTITVAFDATQNLTISDGTTTVDYGAAAAGDIISYSIAGYSGSVTIDDNTASQTATIVITTTGGQTFQLGTDSSTRVAMDLGAGITSGELGDSVLGYLSSLRSGQTNNLSSANVDTAVSIATESSRQVAMSAARVGNFSKHQIGASMKALEAMKEGTSDAISHIQDTDYAEETAMLDRQDILLQAAVSMLSRANSAQLNVLTLLR